MRGRPYLRETELRQRTEVRAGALARLLVLLAACLSLPPCAVGAEAPAWMHALTTVSLPPHDDKADAVQLYSETVLSVRADGRMRRLERGAFRILRPDGEARGKIVVGFSPQSRILDLRGWCIPVTGKDYAVKLADAVESAWPGVQNGELVSDLRAELLLIPAAKPGSIVGYEVEQEQRPYFLDDEWAFQDTVPVREARYTLELPAGWNYRAAWVNHDEVTPITEGGRITWRVGEVAAVPVEESMPAWRGIASRMVVALVPPGSATPGLVSWADVGKWFNELARGRRDASAQIRTQIAALTAGADTSLAKIAALAHFVQTDVRYVAIELGVGGQQPHAATEVFSHRYGDCKDKVTLLSSMLNEIGIESYYVVINTERGAVHADSPPSLHFNHMVMAIKLPDDVNDPSLLATAVHPKLGRILYFDPTDELTPLGRLAGSLQANYGLLIVPDGGELTRLPQLASASNSVQRTAKVALDADGVLRGEVVERRVGGPAAAERHRLAGAGRPAEQRRSVERLMAQAMPSYRILEARPVVPAAIDQPVEWHLSIEAENYGRLTGDLMLVRPRLIGGKSSRLLETREPRRQPIEFEAPQSDSDTFEIELPPHFEVDELPPPVKIDRGFAAYQSRTQLVGRTLVYTRNFEIRELSLPVSRAEELKQLYRAIATDESRSAVLRPAAH